MSPRLAAVVLAAASALPITLTAASAHATVRTAPTDISLQECLAAGGHASADGTTCVGGILDGVRIS